MAFPKQTAFILLVALVTLSFTTTSNAVQCVGKGKIAVYWGQGSDKDEGKLSSVCSSGNYSIVILNQLLVYDDGKDPVLSLENHCDTDYHKLKEDIESCQKNKIQVFLSIGSDTQTPNTTDPDPKAAEKLAKYLFDNYLSGNKDGPLGEVTLDGIDIADVPGGKNLKWDEVVKAIHALSTTAKKIYLSASPQCVYPDTLLGKAIETGYVDYIWLEFFFPNPTCDYATGDASKLLSAFKTWTENVGNSLIFFGLTANKDSEQYIPPEALVSKVLIKSAKDNKKYGGVMISSMVDDLKNQYTPQIKDSVPKDCKCLCDDDATFAANAFYGLPSASI